MTQVSRRDTLTKPGGPPWLMFRDESGDESRTSPRRVPVEDETDRSSPRLVRVRTSLSWREGLFLCRPWRHGWCTVYAHRPAWLQGCTRGGYTPYLSSTRPDGLVSDRS